MGWTDDEIDNLAKNASANQKVAYNNAYWNEMEALLDAEKPVKKRFGWWFFGAIISLLIISTGLYYMIGQNVEKKTETVFAYDVTGVGGNGQVNAPLQKQNNYFKSERSQIVSEKHSQVTTTEINNLERETVFSNSLPKSDLTVVKSSGTTKVVFNEGDQGTTEQNEKHNGNFELAAFVAAHDIVPDVETIKKIQNNDEETHHEQGTESIKPELLENNTAKNMIEDPTLQKKIGFYVAAGAGAGTSYIKNSDELVVQWKLKIGIDYTILNQFRFGGGIGFRQQLLNKLTTERSREYYSLGLIDVNQTVNYDMLQFIDFNLHAHYLFRKMSVGIELTPSYLVGVRANMKQTQIEYEKSFVDEVTTTLEKQFVRSNNFNSFGLDAGISFQYQFKYRMSLEAGVSTRLNKMLMSNDFRGEHNRFPVKLELGLIKRF